MNARTPFNPTEGGATSVYFCDLETEEGRQEEAPSLAVLS